MAERGCGICAGCIGMGPCDDGTWCPGCGELKTLMGAEVCGSCERDRDDDAIEGEYADGDYDW